MKNIFEHIPKEIKSEVFESLVDAANVKIERIISKGHKSPENGWYDQNKNEWVMVLRGEAILLFENQSKIILREGDYINIEAHKKHKVDWTDPNRETIWLAIYY